jgi:glyoxylase-like metal-dependent hydrolase (beta-lactamase superfamily II)
MQHASLQLGNVQVSVMCEGFAPLELDGEMPGAGVDWEAERARHPWAFHDERSWPWHVHAFALRTPHGVVMVDTGLGAFPPYRPWAEHTVPDEALALAGVDAREVRAVVHTHLHADHAGGAIRRGRPRFPNAVHHVHPADWSFFADADDLEDYTARGAMTELESLGLLDLIDADHDVTPDVRVVHAPGHTPGHRVAIVRSRDDVVAIAGDLLHLPVQIARPDTASSHDVDPDTASRSRVRVLQMVRDGGWRLAVSHFARPFGWPEPDGWRSEG